MANESPDMDAGHFLRISIVNDTSKVLPAISSSLFISSSVIVFGKILAHQSTNNVIGSIATKEIVDTDRTRKLTIEQVHWHHHLSTILSYAQDVYLCAVKSVMVITIFYLLLS
ncbi:hypothetical protein LOAG_10080 [Loa loa]|uniref:Uncharacterized protein n=1 Tax=Loa loa TaxID=7209 RepID=A0A1S0TRT9_LOALO|nr:hypothetical protein LOAG_10080 [Loa loa]EFO18416.1 hypothetical protein LOAG_10080 [Loa loa]